MLGVGGALLTDCTLLSHQPLDDFSVYLQQKRGKHSYITQRIPDELFIDI